MSDQPKPTTVQCGKCGEWVSNFAKHRHQPKPREEIEKDYRRIIARENVESPKPTGEWTAEQVRKMLSDYSGERNVYQDIADAHNSALAAHKQQAESMLATSKRVNDQLRKQLAAERELLEQGITAGADWDWHNRVKAALAKVKEGK